MKYKIGSVCQYTCSLHVPQDLPGLTPDTGCEFPDPESIPLSVLEHPLGKRHEINFAAYDPPELSLVEDTHPVSVLCINLLFTALTRNRLGVYYGFIYCDGRPDNPMFKLILRKGEDGHTLVGAGSRYRRGSYEDYEITGKWGPLREGGRIPVELEITHATIMGEPGDQLSGVFDPEENSLRGTLVDLGLSCTPEEFVFKRDPDFVRFYPAPSITNASERWKFATKSVLDRIQRQAWSSKRISKRIKDSKRFIENAVGQHRESDRLSPEEESEYLAALPGLYEADVELYASLIKVNVKKTTYFE